MNYEKAKQEWDSFLQRGGLPCFEIEIKDNEYLLVELSLTSAGITFSFDRMDLGVAFSGNVEPVGEGFHTWLYQADFDFSLDENLQNVYSEIIEGFIIPNDLMATEED